MDSTAIVSRLQRINGLCHRKSGDVVIVQTESDREPKVLIGVAALVFDALATPASPEDVIAVLAETAHDRGVDVRSNVESAIDLLTASGVIIRT